MYDFNRHYKRYREGSIEIFIDRAENPDFDKVQEFVMSVNERVVRDEI